MSVQPEHERSPYFETVQPSHQGRMKYIKEQSLPKICLKFKFLKNLCSGNHILGITLVTEDTDNIKDLKLHPFRIMLYGGSQSDKNGIVLYRIKSSESSEIVLDVKIARVSVNANVSGDDGTLNCMKIRKQFIEKIFGVTPTIKRSMFSGNRIYGLNDPFKFKFLYLLQLMKQNSSETHYIISKTIEPKKVVQKSSLPIIQSAIYQVRRHDLSDQNNNEHCEVNGSHYQSDNINLNVQTIGPHSDPVSDEKEHTEDLPIQPYTNRQPTCNLPITESSTSKVFLDQGCNTPSCSGYESPEPSNIKVYTDDETNNSSLSNNVEYNQNQYTHSTLSYDDRIDQEKNGKAFPTTPGTSIIPLKKSVSPESDIMSSIDWDDIITRNEKFVDEYSEKIEHNDDAYLADFDENLFDNIDDEELY